MIGRVEVTGAKLVAVGNGGIQETETEEWLISFSLNTLMDALESKRGQKRVRSGQKGKVLSGYWPFPDVSVWYKRIVEKTWGKELKLLVKNEEKASILKEWLELFADGVILTKQNLYEFFDNKGLKSNSKINKTWKLHVNIIDSILNLWKLYVYAGYLTYPDWDINELIPAKHPPIISLDTVDKIMNRLHKNKWTVDYKKRGYDQDADEYPLKRILLCPECDRTMTKWKSKSHTGDYHHYYGCNNKECKIFKKSIPRDEVHEAIRQRLKEIAPREDNMKKLEKAFTLERDKTRKDFHLINNNKKNEVKEIDAEMLKIESKLDMITNSVLFEKKQQRRAELSQKKDNLEYEINNVNFDNNEFQQTYNEVKSVIKNPLAVWDLADAEIK